MPLPLNSRSQPAPPGAIVVLSADDYNRLFAVWQALQIGQLQVLYADTGPTGLNIPPDLASRPQLVLPLPPRTTAPPTSPTTVVTGGGLPSGGGNYRVLTAAMSVAGIVPTTTEISTALAAAYTNPDPDLVPANGDLVILTAAGAPKLAYDIRTATVTAYGLFIRDFSVTSTTYYAIGRQLGLY